MKNKLIILSLILSSFSYGKSLSFDESLELYTGNNLSIKNIQLNKEIRNASEKDLINSINNNLMLSGKSTYASDKIGIESKISYKNFYLSARENDVSKSDPTLSLGYERSLNEFLYNTDKGKITKNSLEMEIAENTDKNQKINLIKNFSTSYLEILNLENTIKAKENLLKQKQKEYDTAKIKEQANTLSSYEVRVIKLSVEKLQAEIALAEKEINIKKLEFKNSLNISFDFNALDIEEVKDFNVYVDDSELKILENNIKIAQEELKGIKVSNLPQFTGGLAYEITDSDLSASLSFSWSPLNYKGDEVVKSLSIDKLRNQLEDKKKEIDLSKIKALNEFEKAEINLNLSQKDLELAKAELEKYQTMKNLGTVSEYDYYIKQKEVLDKEIEYLSLKNQLNLNRKLEVIYGSL